MLCFKTQLACPFFLLFFFVVEIITIAVLFMHREINKESLIAGFCLETIYLQL